MLLVNYIGRLENGAVFDQQQMAPLPLDGMIPGFVEGALQMRKGGRYRIDIPAAKAYGAEAKANPMTGEEVIPANSDLVFEVELLDFVDYAQFEAQMRAMQEMMRQQGEGGAIPVPPAPAQ